MPYKHHNAHDTQKNERERERERLLFLAHVFEARGFCRTELSDDDWSLRQIKLILSPKEDENKSAETFAWKVHLHSRCRSHASARACVRVLCKFRHTGKEQGWGEMVQFLLSFVWSASQSVCIVKQTPFFGQRNTGIAK